MWTYTSLSLELTLNSFTKLTFQVPPSLKAERTYTLDFLRETKYMKNNKIVYQEHVLKKNFKNLKKEDVPINADIGLIWEAQSTIA